MAIRWVMSYVAAYEHVVALTGAGASTWTRDTSLDKPTSSDDCAGDSFFRAAQ
jgi:hypothetical protein